MSGLPELTPGQVRELVKEFALSYRKNGGTLVGERRDGQPFTIHLHGRQKVWEQKVAVIVRDLGISRREFMDWWNDR